MWEGDKLRRILIFPRFLTLSSVALVVVAACTSSGVDLSSPGTATTRHDPTPTGIASRTPDSAPVQTATATPGRNTVPGRQEQSLVDQPPAGVVSELPERAEPEMSDGSSAAPTPLALIQDDQDSEKYRPESAPGSDPWSFVSSRTCGDGPLLTALPMDLGNVTNINPLGNLGPPGHTFPTSHMYFGIPAIWLDNGEGPFGDGQVFPPHPVYAVADSQLTSLGVSSVTSSLTGTDVTYDEYTIDIAVCEKLKVRYGHVGPVSDTILAAIADLEPFNCNSYSTGDFAVESCTYAPGLELAAGEQIGFNSGRAAALDIGAYETNTQNIEFLHPELHGEEAKGSVCVLDLYPEDERSAMAAMLGDNNGLRTAEPICGVLNYTVPGTLQGNWFSDIGRFSQEDRNIAFVYDEVLPDVPVISIGFVPGIRSFAHRFEPMAEGRVNRSFVDVEAGAGAFCYENFLDNFNRPGPETHLLVEVPESGRLLVQAIDGVDCGDGPWQIGPDATEFVR